MPSAAYALSAALRAGTDGSQDLELAGIALTNAVKVKVSAAGQGRFYVRGNTVHQASAPGDPPAVDTGVYRASWAHTAGQIAFDVWEARVFPDSGYLAAHQHPRELGVYLEFGTSRMAARPHLRPAAAETAGVLARVAAVGIERRQRDSARL